MKSFRNIADIRFSPDKSGESQILAKIPGLRDWGSQSDLQDYFKLSLGADSLKVTEELVPRADPKLATKASSNILYS